MKTANRLKVFAGAAALILLFAGIYYYSHYYLSNSRGLSEIPEKSREAGDLVFDMVDILQVRLAQSFNGLIDKENARDFKGSSEVVAGSLKIVDELEQKNELLKLKTEEFKTVASRVRTKEAGDTAEKVADILGRLILGFKEMAALERELLNTAKSYYDALAAGQEAEQPSFVSINAKLAVAGTEFASLVNNFAASFDELNLIISGEPAIAKRELKIEDIKAGEGAEAKNGKTLSVHYIGTLENGNKFDSSYDRKTPFSFTLGAGQVIKGWEQGLLGMKIGGKRKLIIPPSLGYGVTGAAGGKIPPNSTLIFEIELLDVK